MSDFSFVDEGRRGKEKIGADGSCGRMVQFEAR